MIHHVRSLFDSPLLGSTTAAERYPSGLRAASCVCIRLLPWSEVCVFDLSAVPPGVVAGPHHPGCQPVCYSAESGSAVTGAAAAADCPPGATHQRHRTAATRHLLHGQTQTGEAQTKAAEGARYT